MTSGSPGRRREPSPWACSWVVRTPMGSRPEQPRELVRLRHRRDGLWQRHVPQAAGAGRQHHHQHGQRRARTRATERASTSPTSTCLPATRTSYVILRTATPSAASSRGIDVEKVDSRPPLTVMVKATLAGNTTGIDASTLTAAMDAGGTGGGRPRRRGSRRSSARTWTTRHGWAAATPPGTRIPGRRPTLSGRSQRPADRSGGPHPEAISLVSGSTVNVAAGLYDERIDVNKPMRCWAPRRA